MARKVIPDIYLNNDSYKDKVFACWIGKNIGGTMGAPYEGIKEMVDITGFASEAGEPLPNDDLDLQLIWLHAVETLGAKAVNAASLGEMWIGLIPPNWNEYGIGKNNMRRGLVPPFSGDYENRWQNSNGAWIRTEIWACLAPGCPQIASKYAIEDAKVDHGTGEGTTAAAFVGAMQSAAFVVNDVRECINLGLKSIPENSRMADSVRFVIDCYEKGMSYVDARNALQKRNADIGTGWFEAPSNVGYAVIGLLWGEGDFKKSMITAINCGDDTDCTAATVGATLGILGGKAAIPSDWQEYIGDKIITISVNRGDCRTGGSVPKTCTELSNRVIKQAPHFLFANDAAVKLTDSQTEFDESCLDYLNSECVEFCQNLNLTPFTAHYESVILEADVHVFGGLDIAPMGSKKVTITARFKRPFGDELKNLSIRWWLPDGFTTSGRKSAYIPQKSHHYVSQAVLEYTLVAGENVDAQNRCVFEITADGRTDVLYVPVLLLG